MGDGDLPMKISPIVIIGNRGSVHQRNGLEMDQEADPMIYICPST